MRRIAIIQRFLPPASRGGAGQFAHGLATTLAARGHDVTVFSEDPAPAGAAYRVTLVARRPGALARRLAPLTFPWRVAKHDFSWFDVVHAQGDDQLIPRRASPPIVRTLHGSSLDEAIANGLRRASLKHLLLHLYFYAWELVSTRRADFVVGVSRDTGRRYGRFHDVVPNGVEIDRFSARAGGKAERPTILFVGELHSRKRGWLLQRVVHDWVRHQVPGVRLWLVSPDAVEDEGVSVFRDLEEEPLAELYRAAWVMCLPSSYEGFGRPYVEALAAGTAVVASPNPGAREVLEEGRYGLIVSDHDLGPALCRLLVNRKEREAYERGGIERALAFSWDHVAARYEAIYEDVIARRARRATA